MSNLLNLFNEAISGSGPILSEFSIENGYEEEGWNLEDLRDVLDAYRPTSLSTFRGVTITVEESWGGEGQGDSIGNVFRLGDEYVRVTGYYTSYDGSNWEDAEPESVVPKEVTVTKYFSA